MPLLFLYNTQAFYKVSRIIYWIMAMRETLNIAWRISRGKKRQSAEKTIDLKDTDNGIMK